jgi:hypothetical protein
LEDVMKAWIVGLSVLTLVGSGASACGEQTAPSGNASPRGPGTRDADGSADDSDAEPGAFGSSSKDAGKAGARDAGRSKADAGKLGAGRAPSRGDAGETTSRSDAGKKSDRGSDAEAEPTAPLEPAEPSGPRPENSTRIADLPEAWREPTCVDVAGQMRAVLVSGGLLDCTGQAIHAATAANDRAGCEPAREICSEGVDSIGVTESCEGTQLLACEEATVAAVKTCLADMKKTLDALNKKLTCATSEEAFLAAALPLPSSCEGVGQSCAALSGLVRLFD